MTAVAASDDQGASASPLPAAPHTVRLVALGGAAVLLIGSGLALWAASGFATPPQVFMSGPAGLLALITASLAQAAGGLIIAIRRPENTVGWVILVFAVAISLTVIVDGYLAYVSTGWSAPIEPAAVALVPGVISFGLSTFVAIALGIIFPDGRIAAPRYRPFIAAAAFGALLFALGVAGTPGPLLWFPTYDNPLPVPGDSPWPALFRYVIGPALLISGVVATSLALVDRYRRADGIGRLQLRWYVASAIILTVGFVAYLIALYTLPPDSPLGELVMVGFFLAAAIPPAATVVAISRYRLYDIDVIIGRAFVYGALTAILAGMYAASIRLFNAVFVGLTGEASEVALVITTLILATTFTPIKSRLERFVATRMGEAAPSPAATAVLDDPRFQAALDERIRVALADTSRRSGAAEEDHPPAG